MPAVPAVRQRLPDDILDAKVKKALDDLARTIGRRAVNHLKEMYPDALAQVTKNAETSLTNHIRNDINFQMRPIMKMLIEAMRRTHP